MKEPVLFHIPEPKLTFGYDQRMSDPRDGITLFGPYTRKKLTGQINIGVIGPEGARTFFTDYLRRIHRPIFSTVQDAARPYFPGLEAAFGIFVNFENLRQIEVPQEDIEKYLKYADGHQRVHNLSNLYINRLIRYSKQEEAPITVWFIIIPDDVYTYGRPKISIPASKEKVNIGLSKHDRDSKDGFLFKEMNELKEAYEFEVNFHNQIKAKLLDHKIVTQIIRKSTIAYQHMWINPKRIEYEKRFDSAKAWNISTTLYYKAGGIPWRLGEVRKKVCYLGLVYKKLDLNEDDRNACCAAQMFLDSGDGMVFRGNPGLWYNPETKEFHLTKDDAADLLGKALRAFKDKFEAQEYPEEFFIHAKTYFNDEEWSGFGEAASEKSKIIGVRIRADSNFKLYRDYAFSVPRGTVLKLDERNAYLWSKGFIPRLETQIGLETPNPLSIEVTRGHADIDVVCKDILSLTKLNYNSCIFGEGLPVTLRFADRIGEVLTAGKNVTSEVLTFKHYI